MWEVEPDNITNILYVSKISWFPSPESVGHERSARLQWLKAN